MRTLVHRYNQAAPAGLGEEGHRHPGGHSLLSGEQQNDLQQARMTHPRMAASGLALKWLPGFWNAPGDQSIPSAGSSYLKQLQFEGACSASSPCQD